MQLLEIETEKKMLNGHFNLKTKFGIKAVQRF